MKKIIPYLFAAAISTIALLSSFSLAEPELGISTTILVWLGCLWLVSGRDDNQGCMS